jgi:hypothetical protein
MSDWSSIDLDVWADVDGTEVEVVQLSVSYEMNAIPKATVVLPVGYLPTPPYTAATTHTVCAGVQLQIPITIYVRGKLWATSSAGVWPGPAGTTTTYTLFCGWVTGVGYRRTAGGYAATLECTHWLSALNFASTLCAISHPNNPAHFTYNSAITQPGGGGTLHFLPGTIAQQKINAVNIANDMWDSALKVWFDSLTCEDRINIVQFQAQGGNAGNDTAAREVRGALAAIEGDLQFNNHGADGNVAAMTIANDIACITLTPFNLSNTRMGMANTTFWDKIVGEIAPRYFFSLIPHPHKAQVVPFIAGLNPPGGVWNPGGGAATILARDQAHQDMRAYLPRALRAVGLFAGHGARSGASMKYGPSTPNDTIGGWYVGRAAGLVLLKKAPSYLANYVVPSIVAADATGLNDVRATAVYPGVGTPNAAVPDADDQRDDAKTLLDELAHAFYVNELLKNRWGDIITAVRFDICPGSTISFQGTDGSAQPPGAGELRYGSVVRVSYFFDAQHQRCYTAYKLAHVRTAAEHADADFTVTAHPLYDNIFTGDHLVESGDTCPSLEGDECT